LATGPDRSTNFHTPTL